jgi:hypothetical protein
MIATELDERGRQATALLMSDVLHCAVLATNFTGCEELLEGEEMSRQLLLCQRNFTESEGGSEARSAAPGLERKRYVGYGRMEPGYI